MPVLYHRADSWCLTPDRAPPLATVDTMVCSGPWTVDESILCRWEGGLLRMQSNFFLRRVPSLEGPEGVTATQAADHMEPLNELFRTEKSPGWDFWSWDEAEGNAGVTARRLQGCFTGKTKYRAGCGVRKLSMVMWISQSVTRKRKSLIVTAVKIIVTPIVTGDLLWSRHCEQALGHVI